MLIAPRPEKLSEIARQLGVGHIVEGSVQKIGDRVRINVQLIEARTDEHLWAELYDRNLIHIFCGPERSGDGDCSKTSGEAHSDRNRQRSRRSRRINLAAYDAYLRRIDFSSRAGQTPADQRQAAELFEEAVRLDPTFAQAWAALARGKRGPLFPAPRRELDAKKGSRAPGGRDRDATESQRGPRRSWPTPTTATTSSAITMALAPSSRRSNARSPVAAKRPKRWLESPAARADGRRASPCMSRLRN